MLGLLENWFISRAHAGVADRFSAHLSTDIKTSLSGDMAGEEQSEC